MTSGFFHNKASSIQLPLPGAQDNAPIALNDVAFFLRMRWRWIVVTTVAFLALAIAYIIVAKPVFVADTLLIIQPQVAASETLRTSAEDAFIEAQLEIANSSDVLGAVALALGLVDDPDFQEREIPLQQSLKEHLIAFTGNPFAVQPSSFTPPTAGLLARSEDQRKLDAVIVRLRNTVTFRRIGRSLILQISASAYSAEKAAVIANAVAREYIRKNIGMNGAAAQQYSTWLEGFMAEQQRGLADAANALIAFRSNPRDQFKLAELQSAADARRALFETTVTKLTEAKQRISYPVSDASIVSSATPPLSKQHPRAGLIVTFAGAVGLTFGLMAALIRHTGDRRITTPRQLAKATTLPFALLLEKSRLTRRIRSGTLTSVFGQRHNANFPSAAGLEELSTIVSALRRRKRNVIGIVAVDAGSGATTIALELAVLSARSGSETLLIDAASKTGGLSRWISPGSDSGIMDVLDGDEPLATASLQLLPALRFLPLGKVTEASPAVRFSSRRTQLSLSELKKSFDTVLVDLNAVATSSDANAVGPELDGVLIVTCYGRTSIDEVTRAIESLRNVGTEVLGVVINKTPARWLS